MPQPLMFFFAFLAVLAMIGAAAWLVRRFAGNRLGTSTKSGRMPRLAVIDAAAVDGRRRLVLVRRDNIEHLLMIGGPSDIVVESNIVRANPARDAGRPGLGVEPRISPPDWEAESSSEAPEPLLPELPPRPARPSFADDTRRPAPPVMPPRRASEFPTSDPFAGLVPEPAVRPEAPVARAEPRPEIRPEPRTEARPEPRLEAAPRPRPDPVMPRPPRPELPKAPLRAERPIPPSPPAAPVAPTIPAPSATPQPAAAAADQNLAEMANRLEAALRRPADAKPDVAPPAAEAPARPARAPEPRSEPPAAAAPTTKSGFESLEDEMASLLGRPKTPS